MSPLLLIWIVCVGIVGFATKNDLQSEVKSDRTAILFEHKQDGSRHFTLVKVKGN